jgi:hypothetical protein
MFKRSAMGISIGPNWVPTCNCALINTEGMEAFAREQSKLLAPSLISALGGLSDSKSLSINPYIRCRRTEIKNSGSASASRGRRVPSKQVCWARALWVASCCF